MEKQDSVRSSFAMVFLSEWNTCLRSVLTDQYIHNLTATVSRRNTVIIYIKQTNKQTNIPIGKQLIIWLKAHT